MRRLFNSDSPVFRFMTILLELAEMNILFLLCSLPVVTMGAAYAALLHSLYDLHAKGEGCFSVRHFWNVFRASLKKSLPVWCIGLASMGFLLYGILYWFSVLGGGTRILICGFYIAAAVLVFGMLQFCFFFLGMTGELNRETVKDCFLLSLAKYPGVILNALLSASVLMVLGMTGSVLARMLPLILLYWFACPAYVCVLILEWELRPLFPEIFHREQA